jgi:hypothetical protein
LKNSFESLIQDDVLAKYQNGYDGVIEVFDLKISTKVEKFNGRIELLVLSIEGGAESWHRLVITLASVSFARISDAVLLGGG